MEISLRGITLNGKLGKKNSFVTIFYVMHTTTTPTKRVIYLRSNGDVGYCTVTDQMNRAVKLARL